MALVLYHVEDAAKEKQLSALCRELHLTARRLTNADRDRAVAALCGEKVNANVQKAPAGYKLPEVLIFSGFAGEMLDVFLAAYKKAGIAPIPLKAVHTEHNDKWSLYALCEELRREGVGVGTSEILDAFAALEHVPWTDQSDFREALAATWLAGNGDDYADTPVRFDEVAMMVVKENRALLRHHINCFGEMEPLS